MGYDDELKMEQNQLYLIKQLESKVKNLKKAIIEPEQYNVGLASKERLSELEERVEGLEKEVKKILYAIGK
jgi:tetrahydromethanopterin S-methyltransferase subunit G